MKRLSAREIMNRVNHRAGANEMYVVYLDNYIKSCVRNYCLTLAKAKCGTIVMRAQ